jgi:hypothetical protein
LDCSRWCRFTFLIHVANKIQCCCRGHALCEIVDRNSTLFLNSHGAFWESKLWCREMDWTGSGSCTLQGCDASGLLLLSFILNEICSVFFTAASFDYICVFILFVRIEVYSHTVYRDS